jgi:tetraacyldisaccharide 4'-kinase
MNALERAWWRREEGLLARALLAPLALPEAAFRAGVALRGLAYDHGLLPSTRAGAPVISVGNVAVGGAGKTPVALEVARRLQRRGRRVAILSRGYGARRTDARVVSDGGGPRMGAADAGDEPALLALRLPGVAVLCGPGRAELARLATGDLGADALVLDDGFQHRALGRDLDVAVLDATNPFGNGRLLPRGPNREPRGALRRAGLVWLTRADQARPGALEPLRALAREATGAEAVESRHAPVDVLDGALARSLGREALRGRRVLLLAGIARPEGFRRTLEGLEAAVARERAYPDHHGFTDRELDEALAAAGEAGCDLVVMTEKDAVRLAPERAADPRLAAVRIDAEVLRGEAGLEAALDRALGGGPAEGRAAT